MSLIPIRYSYNWYHLPSLTTVILEAAIKTTFTVLVLVLSVLLLSVLVLSVLVLKSDVGYLYNAVKNYFSDLGHPYIRISSVSMPSYCSQSHSPYKWPSFSVTLSCSLTRTYCHAARYEADTQPAGGAAEVRSDDQACSPVGWCRSVPKSNQDARQRC